MRSKTILKGFLLLLVLSSMMIAFFYRENFQKEEITLFIEQLGNLGPLVYILIYAIAPGLGLPALPLTLLGGALFGPFWGAICTLIGASIADAWAFLLARYVAKDWVEKKAKGIVKRVKEGIEKEGWRFIAFARLTPIFPFSLVSYAMGLTKVSFWVYAITTFFCIIPGAVTYTYIGYASRQALEGQEGFLQTAFIAVGLLIGVAFLAYFLQKRNKKTTTPCSPE